MEFLEGNKKSSQKEANGGLRNKNFQGQFDIQLYDLSFAINQSTRTLIAIYVMHHFGEWNAELTTSSLQKLQRKHCSI